MLAGLPSTDEPPRVISVTRQLLHLLCAEELKAPRFPADLSSCTSARVAQFPARGRGLSLQFIRLLIGWAAGGGVGGHKTLTGNLG